MQQTQASINFIRRHGNTALVALQGCNLRCLGCTHSEMQNVCFDCGKCTETCPTHALELENGKVRWEPVACCACGACTMGCTHQSSPMVRVFTPNELWREIKQTVPQLQILQFVGGEVALQPQFVAEVCALAHAAGVQCLAKTNGTVPLAQALVAALDGVTVDLKPWNAGEFFKWTGRRDSEEVPNTLRTLLAAGKLQALRFVVLPRMMNTEATLQEVSKILGQATATVPLQLVAFRPRGVRGRLAKAVGPEAETMRQLQESANAQGFIKAEICSL